MWKTSLLVLMVSSQATMTFGQQRFVDPTLDDVSNAELYVKGRSDPLHELLGLVADNTFGIHKREMPAYWQLLALAKNKTMSALLQESQQAPPIGDFYLSATKRRGELVFEDFNIRRVVKYSAREGNPAAADCLYEIWGSTDQSKSWLYVFVTTDLPPGMNEGSLVNKRAKFAGYFFKLLAYHSAKSKPSDKPQVAPLLIGKFELGKELPKSESKKDWPLGKSIGLTVLVMSCIYGGWRFSRRRPILNHYSDRSKSIDVDDLPEFEDANSVEPDGIRAESDLPELNSEG